MSENCTHNCETCGENCASRKTNPADFREPPHALSSIKKVIGVVSGKGGVGKSLVCSMLAVEMRRRDYSTAILDADITGPSAPQARQRQAPALAHRLDRLRAAEHHRAAEAATHRQQQEHSGKQRRLPERKAK